MRESEFKDLFSRQSADYAKFRPRYPTALFEYLTSLPPERRLAWDVGTGNGQSAVKLAEFFDRVVATDPSQKQLDSAEKHARVEYRAEPAERSSLASQSVDLVAVAQAFHWFKQDEFFAEVARVLKPGGVLALWCYELARVTPAVDAVVDRLYRDILGAYWEKERRLVEEGYRGVHLPFSEVTPPRFEMSADWSFEHLIGYLGTWSALQTYVGRHGKNPVEAVFEDLRAAWGAMPSLPVRWELGLRVGRFTYARSEHSSPARGD